jgi:RimJ/RimL family protein N-acetyltransferase
MAHPVESFRTSRLEAARLRTDDWAPLFRLHRDRRVMATLGGLQGPEQTRSGLSQHIDHWERYGFGLWAFRHRSTNAFVGRAGLRHVEGGGAAEVGLAYALRAGFWRRGLATEMAAAILERAFGALGLSNVVALALTSNRSSRRVMEKLGFRYEGHVRHAGLPHVLTRIRARHRIASRSAPSAPIRTDRA